MAEPVFAYLKMKRNLLIEVGTGIGKSFAYVILPQFLQPRRPSFQTPPPLPFGTIYHGNLTTAINNSDEKEYNVSLAKTILKVKGDK